MNFQIKFPYSLIYKGAYGKQERNKILFYMVIYIITPPSFNGDHYAYN